MNAPRKLIRSLVSKSPADFNALGDEEICIDGLYLSIHVGMYSGNNAFDTAGVGIRLLDTTYETIKSVIESNLTDPLVALRLIKDEIEDQEAS